MNDEGIVSSLYRKKKLACLKEMVTVFIWSFLLEITGNAFEYFSFFMNRLDASETGLQALVQLSNGDVRKALNILQVLILFTLMLLFLCISIHMVG